MGEQADEPGIRHVPTGHGETTWVDGDVYTVKADGAVTGGSLSFLEASVPPGSGPPPHVHAREDEAFYILAGELEFRGTRRSFRAGAGDFVFVPRGTAHSFENVGVHAVRMVFFYTPAGFEQFFLEAGSTAVPGTPIPSWGPAEFARATEIAAHHGWRAAPDGR